MMKIDKRINNNIVIVQENGHEKIIMGRGIGFKSQIGEEISEENIEKVFYLSSKHMNQLFDILKDIPYEYIDISYDIYSYACHFLNKQLDQFLIISLSDHIYSAITRFKEGIIIKNKLLWEIKNFYSDEFRIGEEALKIIKNKLDLLLPEDEAGFIALHIVNAHMNMEEINLNEMTKRIQDIVHLISYHFMIPLDHESLYYYRFITHLKFFLLRLMKGELSNDSTNDQLFLLIKDKYKKTYKCVQKIKTYIFNNLNYNLSNEEQLYLIIHIEKMISKTIKGGEGNTLIG